MNILILNWRDIKNSRAGGAELLTQEVAKRWVVLGHTVTIFCERFEGATSEEIIDGVTVVRRGRWWSVHFWAMIYYFFRFRKYTDIIVDEVHWYPFFSVLYAPQKSVLLVCEVASRLFFRLFPYPVAIFGRFVEKIYVFLYRRTPVIAISDSTRRALLDEGFIRKNITVIPMGLSIPGTKKRFHKSSRLTIIVVGRLHVLKGVADAISAFVHIQTRIPLSNLWIVGGDSEGYQSELKRQVDGFGMSRNVTFFGRVSEEKKFELLSRAHILLMPSVHEGWGLVVAEAASQGTPAVGYRTAGVKDVIVDGETGVLVAPGDSDALATETLKLWGDQSRYQRYQKTGRKRAHSMHWDDTARESLAVLQQIYVR